MLRPMSACLSSNHDAGRAALRLKPRAGTAKPACAGWDESVMADVPCPVQSFQRWARNGRCPAAEPAVLPAEQRATGAHGASEPAPGVCPPSGAGSLRRQAWQGQLVVLTTGQIRRPSLGMPAGALRRIEG